MYIGRIFVVPYISNCVPYNKIYYKVITHFPVQIILNEQI